MCLLLALPCSREDPAATPAPALGATVEARMAATGIPDISVQVISPSDTSAGTAREVAEYLAAGSLRVWAVYPEGRWVVVHCADGSVLSCGESDVITDEELLPGFFLPLPEIFQ